MSVNGILSFFFLSDVCSVVLSTVLSRFLKKWYIFSDLLEKSESSLHKRRSDRRKRKTTVDKISALTWSSPC